MPSAVRRIEHPETAPDRDWWRGYRRTLEQRFAQDELVIRSQIVEQL